MNRVFMKYFKLFLIALCLFSTKYSTSQVSTVIHTVTKDISLNINGGSLVFFGDVKQNGFLPSTESIGEWRWGGGAYIRKMLSPAWGIDIQYLKGELSGVNTASTSHFTSGISEINISAVFMVSELVDIFSSKSRFDLFIKAGLGSVSFNTSYENTNIVNPVIGTESNTTTNVPICLGLQYKLNDMFNLTFETSYRITNTDYIDYINIKNSGNDGYSYTCLGIVYKFAETRDNSKKSYKCIGF